MCNHPHRKGQSLDNKEAHKKDHQNWSRRSFLETLGLAGGSAVMLGGLPVHAVGKSPFAFMNSPDNENRILVLIRLKGGNDGLNMIVPSFDFGTYSSNRPNIAIEQNEMFNLNSEFGMPNYMDDLMPLWQDGNMKVINSVGYPDPNLSHFDSTDIWSSASNSDNIRSSGWLGRFYENCNPDHSNNPSDIPPAIKIGGPNSIIFNNEEALDLSVNVSSATELERIAETGMFYDNLNVPNDCYYGEQVGFVRTIANSVFRYAEIIAEAFEAGTNRVDYSGILGSQLSAVSRLIKGNLGTQLYLVTLDGFDTHVDQEQDHATLMNDLSNGVASFFQDLEIDGLDENVLCMTFSEFGRRVQQNASRGTDHGTAAPVMLFGPSLNGNGILGKNPDLQDLDETGNLKHDIDFRSIYASILEYWLCISPTDVDEVLGSVFERLELGIQCSPISSTTLSTQSTFKHSVQNMSNGSIRIHYETSRPDNVAISVYSILGQKIQDLQNEYKVNGQHFVDFHSQQYGLASMPLVYKIRYGKKEYSGKMIVVR